MHSPAYSGTPPQAGLGGARFDCQVPEHPYDKNYGVMTGYNS